MGATLWSTMSATGGTLKSTTNEQRKEERNKALLSQGQNNIGHKFLV